MTNILPLVTRINNAFHRTERGRAEWIEGTLELASALAEGRADHKSNIAFGEWLTANTHADIGTNDRAALIQMAGNLPLARQILEKTCLRGWQHIWNKEMRGRVTPESKTPTVAVSVAPKKPKAEPKAKAPKERKKRPYDGLLLPGLIAMVYPKEGNSKTRTLKAMMSLAKYAKVNNLDDIWKQWSEGVIAHAELRNTDYIKVALGFAAQDARTQRFDHGYASSEAAQFFAALAHCRAGDEPLLEERCKEYRIEMRVRERMKKSGGRHLTNEQIDPMLAKDPAKFAEVHGHCPVRTAQEKIEDAAFRNCEKIVDALRALALSLAPVPVPTKAELAIWAKGPARDKPDIKVIDRRKRLKQTLAAIEPLLMQLQEFLEPSKSEEWQSAQTEEVKLH